MRLVLVLVAAVLLIGCIAVDTTREVHTSAPPPTPPILNSPEAAGKVTVLESEKEGRAGFTYLTVAYENTTALTLARVTLRCRGFDEAGYQIAVTDRLIEGASEGPIGPGFKIRKQFGLLEPGIVSTTCSVARTETEAAGR